MGWLDPPCGTGRKRVLYRLFIKWKGYDTVTPMMRQDLLSQTSHQGLRKEIKEAVEHCRLKDNEVGDEEEDASIFQPPRQLQIRHRIPLVSRQK